MNFYKYFYIISALLFFSSVAIAQEKVVKVGDKVQNIDVRDSKNDPVAIPYFGEKVLMIFYSDPEKPNRNAYLVERLKEEELNGDDFYGFGIVNMKDAPFYPDGLIRFMIRHEERKNAKHNVKIYTDPEHILKKAWSLGNVDDQFALLVVSKDGKLLFYQEEELTKQETESFISWIKTYLGR